MYSLCQLVGGDERKLGGASIGRASSLAMVIPLPRRPAPSWEADSVWIFWREPSPITQREASQRETFVFLGAKISV